MPPTRASASKRRSHHSGQQNGNTRRNAPSVNSMFEVDEDNRSNELTLFSISIPNPLSYFRRSDDDAYSSSGSTASFNAAKNILYSGALLIVLACLFDTYFRSPTQQSGEEILGSSLPHVARDGKYHGKYPNSLLTLFYPFTLFRDVVCLSFDLKFELVSSSTFLN
jgi:hypothetical protein